MTAKRKAKVLSFRRRKEPEGALSDEALLAACGTGDANALAGLYDRYSADVCRFLSRLGHVDTADIEDLLQEVFIAAFRAAHRYRGDACVRSWFFGVAANIARCQARAGKRRRLFHELAILQPVTDTTASPDIEAMNRELVARLEKALPELSHALQVAFIMVDIEGIPGVETAKALGIPVGTLYRRVHEARRALREALDGGES